MRRVWMLAALLLWAGSVEARGIRSSEAERLAQPVPEPPPIESQVTEHLCSFFGPTCTTYYRNGRAVRIVYEQAGHEFLTLTLDR